MFTTIAVLSLFGAALAGPVAFGSGAADNKVFTKRDDVHCGTTSDATLSDCQALVTPEIWDQAFNTDNTCHFTNVLANVYDYPAFNLACHGNCCLYYTAPSDKFGYEYIYQSKETLRQNAQGLLGCGDASANKINGLNNLDGYSICLSDGNGCSDCFDDSDYAFRK